MADSGNGPRWPAAVGFANALLLVAVAAAVLYGAYWLQTAQENPLGVSVPGARVSPPADPPSVVGVDVAPRVLPLPPPPKPASEDLVIDVDREGKIRFEGEIVELPVLRMKLCALSLELRRRAQVTIRAADDCLFRHVKDVIGVCNECVISTYRVSSPPEPSQHAGPSPTDTSAV